jgi:hypothetical protein
MLKRLAIVLSIIACFALQFCSTSKSAAAGKKDAEPVAGYSYSKDVAPIMQARCTPCHFPDGGKKKFLDTHAAVSANIDDIIRRVELPMDSSEFMPFKSKKPPLSDSLINVLKVWKETGMPE